MFRIFTHVKGENLNRNRISDHVYFVIEMMVLVANKSLLNIIFQEYKEISNTVKLLITKIIELKKAPAFVKTRLNSAGISFDYILKDLF